MNRRRACMNCFFAITYAEAKHLLTRATDRPDWRRINGQMYNFKYIQGIGVVETSHKKVG
jgi:hypothetical protein